MELVDRVLSHLQWYTFCFVEWLVRCGSRVGREPFLDLARFPWVGTVESATPAMLDELRRVQATQIIPNFQDISSDQEDITDDDRWKTFFLYGYGYRDEENCRLCPATDRALQAIPGLKTAMFSILAPGKVLPSHRGPYNGVLRYHLGLVIPDNGTTSGIRVGGETRGWQVGKSLIFDDTFEHEAWNHSEQQRVVLFVDLERPLYFPVNLLNKLVLAAIRHTRFVEEAVENLRAHRERTREAARTPV